MNAVVYIGHDDLYMLSFKELNAQGDFVVTPMETTLRRDFLTTGSYRSTLIYDPRTQSILVVAIASNESTFNRLWCLNLKTKGESVWQFPSSFTAIGKANFAPRLSYQDLIDAGTTYQQMLDAGLSYMSFLVGFGTDYLLLSTASGALYTLGSGLKDFGTTELVPLIETGDMDFDSPDDMKTLYRLGLLISGSCSAVVSGSSDSGVTWKSLGTVTILNCEEELHFRLSGDKLALKIQIPAIYSSLVIETLTMSLKVSGEHVIRGGE
jgi:hypothetical protein